MHQIQISLADYDRLNQLALLPMADASFEQDPRRGPVLLTFESDRDLEQAIEAMREQRVDYQSVADH